MNEARLRERLTQWAHDHGRAVRGYLLALVRDRAAAEDLAQEVFYRAWRGRHGYAESGQERAYLMRIADRLVCDRARSPRREVPLDGDCWRLIEPASCHTAPLDGLVHDENCQLLAKALNSLSEPQQRTLLLRYYGGLEFHEIAAILECPLNTVLSHSRRGLLAMRRLLVGETS
jgi:RNA polymerase sigma-70 factor (ECF subfamily)